MGLQKISEKGQDNNPTSRTDINKTFTLHWRVFSAAIPIYVPLFMDSFGEGSWAPTLIAVANKSIFLSLLPTFKFKVEQMSLSTLIPGKIQTFLHVDEEGTESSISEGRTTLDIFACYEKNSHFPFDLYRLLHSGGLADVVFSPSEPYSRSSFSSSEIHIQIWITVPSPHPEYRCIWRPVLLLLGVKNEQNVILKTFIIKKKRRIEIFDSWMDLPLGLAAY